ncbi:PREDICTED: uncharacterized protein LOC105567402 [Vollenhovia emeryi]|uniref:uncharacterized protein LOC105567402 n=1 Tax=Vollenhovia emeryi TaxID=411798 RepID=UPI0005F4A135|nr:PREDICTED: uncharacterized protein LOC105567402 [Vollenhovia emeryi]
MNGWEGKGSGDEDAGSRSTLGGPGQRHRFKTKLRKSAVPELGTVLPSSPADDSSWADSDLPEIKSRWTGDRRASKFSTNFDVIEKDGCARRLGTHQPRGHSLRRCKAM